MPAARFEDLLPALALLGILADGACDQLRGRRPAVAQFARALEELDEVLPLRRRAQALVFLRRAVTVAGQRDAVDDLELQRLLEVVPVDLLAVGRDLDDRRLPRLFGNQRDQRRQFLVWMRSTSMLPRMRPKVSFGMRMIFGSSTEFGQPTQRSWQPWTTSMWAT
jgi:hypothetical protein